MRCKPSRLLSAAVDGDLSSRSAEQVRVHLQECVACRHIVEELTSLKSALAASPPPPAPEADFHALWSRVQKESAALPERVARYVPWALAAGMLCAAVALGSYTRRERAAIPSDGALIVQAESEFRAADGEYAHALDKLRQVTAHARAAWPKARQAEYDDAQAKLEEATERCREVALAAPANPRAEALLYDAYRRQIRFFEDQLLRGTGP